MPHVKHLFKSYENDFFAIRVPYLSLIDLNRTLEEIELGGEANTKKAIDQLLCQPEFLEAIYIASKDFYLELLTAQKNGHYNNKIIDTVIKYLIRMGSRCTPFGTFSGLSTGKITNRTDITLKNGSFRKFIKPDSEFLEKIASILREKKEFRNHFLFQVNSSLYKFGSTYKFAEQTSTAKGNRKFKTTSVERSAPLDFILSKINASSLEQIVQLFKDQGVDQEEAESFIDDLIQSQILVSNFEMGISTLELFETIRSAIDKIQSDDVFINSVSTFFHQIESYNKYSDNVSIDLLKDIDNLPLAVADEDGARFQIDSYCQFDNCEINNDTVDAIKTAVGVIAPLTPASSSANNIQLFTQDFYAKYDKQSVPISVVFDSENGINYGGKGKASNDSPRGFNGDTFKFKLKIYTDSVRHNKEIVELNENDFDQFQYDGIKVNPSMAIFGKLAKFNEKEVFQLNVCTSTATNTLTRFCEGDKDLNIKVQDLIDKEENYNTDKIFAEIVHVPRAKVNNVTSRPHLRSYEIPYLATSTKQNSQRLLISDLHIKIENNRLILFSKKLGKEVVPRLTTAHNFLINSLPIYHFLCDIQYYERQHYIYWDWEYLAAEDFLPRVIFKNVILSPKIWNVALIKILESPISSSNDELFDKLRDLYRIPDIVYLIEPGKEDLYLDLSFRSCRHTLVKSLKKYKNVVLKEAIEQPLNSVVSGRNGVFANEIVIPMVDRNISKIKQEAVRIDVIETNLKRKFFLGSEWLYYKIYANPIFFNEILLKIIPIVKKFQKVRKVKGWFFVRYRDEEDHLRLRIQFGEDLHKLGILAHFNKIFAKLEKDGRVQKIQVDTYEREIERYGQKNYATIENLFCINSEFAQKLIIENYLGFSGFGLSLLGALVIKQTLVDFGYDLSLSHEYCNTFLQRNGKEFRFDRNSAFKNTLQDDFRKLEKLVTANEGDSEIKNKIELLNSLLQNNSRLSKDLVSRIIENLKTIESKDNLIGNLIHMAMNRLFEKSQRENEFKSYYVLQRLLKTELFFLKSKNEKPERHLVDI